MVGISESLWRQRKRIREVEGSPIYHLTNSTSDRYPETNSGSASILAGGEWTYHLTEHGKPWEKYVPFNTVTVLNEGTSHIQFSFNGCDDLKYWIPASGDRTIEKEGLRSFRIENIGTTDLTPETLEIAFYNSGMTSDKAAKRQYKEPLLIEWLKNGWKLSY